ncbi:MAG: hypothetical protein K6G26_07685 [Lachnospiraceae bacterium]|nr:hypothetical protein [Lachnospiraceae bacterium]
MIKKLHFYIDICTHLFGVKIIKGEKYVNKGMIEELSKRLGQNVPEAFYKGFPNIIMTVGQRETNVLPFFMR